MPAKRGSSDEPAAAAASAGGGQQRPLLPATAGVGRQTKSKLADGDSVAASAATGSAGSSRGEQIKRFLMGEPPSAPAIIPRSRRGDSSTTAPSQSSPPPEHGRRAVPGLDLGFRQSDESHGTQDDPATSRSRSRAADRAGFRSARILPASRRQTSSEPVGAGV